MNDRQVTDETAIVHERISGSLVEIVSVDLGRGYTSHRTTCPDGQFWWAVSGEQTVRQQASEKVRAFQLRYYAPREPAVRITEVASRAYGVRFFLSRMESSHFDAHWSKPKESGPQIVGSHAQGRITDLIEGALSRRYDLSDLDEIVSIWISEPGRSKRDGQRPTWLERARDEIAADPSKSLHCLAREVGIAPAYLSNQFKLVYGETISDFRRSVRVTQALRLARDMTPNEAAIEAGFYDASHFYRACKQALRVPPARVLRLLQTS
jgi:AraC-like DNA-binding protein